MNLEQQAKELLELAKKATQGPWMAGSVYRQCSLDHSKNKHEGKCVYPATRIEGDKEGHSIISFSLATTSCNWDSEDPACVAGNYDYEEGGIIHPYDTAFILAARNDAPDLIKNLFDKIKRLQEIIDVQKELLDLYAKGQNTIEKVDS